MGVTTIDLATLNDIGYQLARGTATSIVLEMPIVLTNGYPKSFIASANNNASATTINGVNLYKPNTTTAPNLIKGKAYTVWYDLIKDCFFIKASAEGNAVAGNVLAGQIFSNDDYTGIVGTMPNRGNVANTITTQGGQYTVPSGYHSGSGKVTASFNNLVAGNIKKGVNVGGVVGSVVEGIQFSTGNINSGHSNTWEERRTLSVRNLTFRPNLVIAIPNKNALYTKSHYSIALEDSNCRILNLINYNGTTRDGKYTFYNNGFDIDFLTVIGGNSEFVQYYAFKI